MNFHFNDLILSSEYGATHRGGERVGGQRIGDAWRGGDA